MQDVFRVCCVALFKYFTCCLDAINYKYNPTSYTNFFDSSLLQPSGFSTRSFCLDGIVLSTIRTVAVKADGAETHLNGPVRIAFRPELLEPFLHRRFDHLLKHWEVDWWCV